MNSIETTDNYPAESGSITKVRKGEIYYHSPNQHYGGKKTTSSVRKQTKAVGLTMGDQKHQMNRPVEYAQSGKFIRIKNQLISPGPGLAPPKAKVNLPTSKEGTHPINRGSMKGVIRSSSTKKSEGGIKRTKKQKKKVYKNLTKKLK
jgi:hypothetical protein